MKRCPTCQTTYTNDKLQYCLEDGSALVPTSATYDPEATLINSPAPPTLQWPVDNTTPVPTRRMTAPQSPANVPPTAPKSNKGLIIAIAVAACALVGGALAVALLWPSRNAPQVAANPTPTPAAKPSVKPTPKPAASVKPMPTPPPRAEGEVDFTVTASSTRAPFNGIPYPAANVRDGLWETAWIEGDAGPGLAASLTCNFAKEISLQSITITPGYFKSPSVWEKNNRLQKATFYFSDGTSQTFDFADDMRHVTLAVGPVKTKSVRLVIDAVYAGTEDADDTAISDISFTLAR